jgi:hypothetical protein
MVSDVLTRPDRLWPIDHCGWWCNTCRVVHVYWVKDATDGPRRHP